MNPETSTREPTSHQLQELLDKQEISEVVLRYCRGVDRRDDELIRSAYHADAHEHHGAYRGRSADDFVTYANGRSDLFERVAHYVCNQLIDVQGNVAFSETYAIALHQSRTEAGVVTHTVFGGRYIDRMEHRDGRWAISDRVVVCDWSRVDDVKEWERAGLFAQAANDRSDPAYDRALPGPGARLRSAIDG